MDQNNSVNSNIKRLTFEYRYQSNTIKELKKRNDDLLAENIHLNSNLNRVSEQLQQYLDKTVKNDNAHLLYTSLKEKYELLLKEIENTKQEKEILMKHYEEKISQYKNEIEKEKHRAELKEIEFNEQFQVHQASVALQNDDLESLWQGRLDIVNQQLKDSNITCNLLRNQLVDLKNRFSYSSIESEKRVLELEQSRNATEEKLRRTEEQFLAKRQTNIRTYRTCNTPNLYTANRPYNYSIEKGGSTAAFSNNVTLSSSISKYEPLGVKITAELGSNESPTGAEILPKRQKRRKLYNIDEFVD